MPEMPLDPISTPAPAPKSELAPPTEPITAIPSQPDPEPTPMLDVHPPHEALHTWKGFFIHIATIVIGLLIAISLEQTVEYFHHRELAKHARELLAQEIELNRGSLHRNLYSLKMHQDYLFNDLIVLQRVRTHQLNPADRIVVWHPWSTFAQFSWQTIHESGAAAYLSYDELHLYARANNQENFFNTLQDESTTALQRAQSIFYRGAADRFDYDLADRTAPSRDGYGVSGDDAAHRAFEDQAPGPDKLNRLTPTQIDRLEQAIQQAVYEDDRLVNHCTNLIAIYNAILGPEKSVSPK